MTRTYRNTLVIPIFGLFLVLFSLVVSSKAIYHLATGTPMIARSGRNDVTGHVASQQEMVTSAVIPLIATVLGSCLIFGWKSMTIELDNMGIRQRGFTGKVTFDSSWKELTEVDRRMGSRGRSFYIIASKSGTMEFANTEGNLAELTGEVKRKAVHLDFSKWG